MTSPPARQYNKSIEVTLPMNRPKTDSSHTYQITIEGRIDARWAGWFNGLAITGKADQHGRPITLLNGQVADQAALRGILNRLWDLNLVLLSVSRLKEPQEENGADYEH